MRDAKRLRIDLGIAIAHATTLPGQRRTFDEIAAYCGCSRQAIQQIEIRAFNKIRSRLQEHARDWGIK